MGVSVLRKNIKLLPDSSRVVARFFMNGDDRTRGMAGRVLAMDEDLVAFTLEQTLREFANRHRNISRIFLKHCNMIRNTLEEMGISYEGLSDERKMLISSYCTMEYSTESTSFFNPSIEDFDQSRIWQKDKNEWSCRSGQPAKAIFPLLFSEGQSWMKTTTFR